MASNGHNTSIGHHAEITLTDYPSRLADRFIIRLPDGWRERLKENAARNRRSMNAEVLCILQGALGEAAGEDFGEDAPAAGAEAIKAHDGGVEA